MLRILSLIRTVGRAIRGILVATLVTLSFVAFIVFVSPFYSLRVAALPLLQTCSVVVIAYFSVRFAILGEADLFQRFGSLLVASAVFFSSLQIWGQSYIRKKIDGQIKSDEMPAYTGENEFAALAMHFWAIPFLLISSRMAFSIELALIFAGTIQWGFGDMFVKWIHDFP